MAETRKEQKSYANTLQLARTAARLRAAQGAGGEPHAVASLGADVLRVGEAVARLCQLGGGWLRLVPDKDGRIWCKWRYTEGRWEGHYSLAVHNPSAGTLGEALEALEHKIMGASLSLPTHKPSPDRY